MERRATPQLLAAWIAALAFCGCAGFGGGGTAPVGAPAPNAPGSSAPPTVDSGGLGGPNDPIAGGPSGTQRAQSALQSMVVGAVIGSSFGPIGMAAGAGTMLIYGALTGNVPFSGGGGGYGGGYGGPYDPYDPYGGPYDPNGQEARREQQMESQLGGELARGDALEGEIDAELRRQEELLHQIEQQEALRDSAQAAIGTPITDEELEQRVDPRVAPPAPRDRELPAAIFEEERATIPKKAWDNKKKLSVLKRSLDADRDGNPEQVRYFDEKSGQMIRKEQDRNYDGKSDAWSVYESGALVSRKLDNDSDGEVDVWETYANGRMVSREVDRDGDGVRDAFYTYEGESLVRESHDANNDGKPDLLVTYRDRQRVMTEEDTDRNGSIDSWTSWTVVGKQEVMARLERDTDGDGKKDLFETYEPQSGRPVLARREEDKNGDGSVDVTSIYENGRLKSREINDPSLVPL